MAVQMKWPASTIGRSKVGDVSNCDHLDLGDGKNLDFGWSDIPRCWIVSLVPDNNSSSPIEIDADKEPSLQM
jgi:hypothetical protein